ncbi:MAG: PolC-type DNA polymerase III [Lachnospiraceae bacterium]|nr:PolC-type DNA polymerase III [Lachnospiraceae bacterium]
MSNPAVKNLYDVFPAYHPKNEESRELFEDTTVNRITSNGEKTKVDVYLTSNHLIHKKDIMETERGLTKMIFPGNQGKVTLHEAFRLSKRYDLENLMREYGTSILYEMKVDSPLMFSIYRNAGKNVENQNDLHLVLPDTVIARSFEQELYGFLKNILCERCGLEAGVTISYEKAALTEQEKLDNEAAQKKYIEIKRNISAGEKKPDKPKKWTGGKPQGNYPDRRKRRERSGGSAVRKSDDPDVFFGGDMTEAAIPISNITGPMNEVTIRGMIRKVEERLVSQEKWAIFSFDLTDFTDSIGVTLLVKAERAEDLRPHFQEGSFIKLNGDVYISSYDQEKQENPELRVNRIYGIRKIEDFRQTRMDNAPEKRVELHCHTKMSRMDAVSDLADLTKNAIRWGWKSISITDHGTVQSFPVSINNDFYKALGDQKLPEDFKFIYGLEGYLVDDLQEPCGRIGNPDTDGCRLDDTFCVFDIETTGFYADEDRIIEIGAVLVQDGRIVDTFDELIDPLIPIPYRIEKLTGIRDEMVQGKDTIEKVLPRFLDFTRGAALAGHNVRFDLRFIEANAARQGIPFEQVFVDTMNLSRLLLPSLAHHKLNNTAKELGISLLNHHRASDDAACTAEIFLRFVEMLREQGIETVEQLEQSAKLSDESIKKLMPFHVILLAQNDIGRVNLYRLVSKSYLQYFYQKPKIPKSELIKHREGLIIGSACEQGELFRALVDHSKEEDVLEIARFYDYLEIQPLGNNEFLLSEELDNGIRTRDDLEELNRRIIDLGEKLKIPVCATGDVHFTEPGDALYRAVIMDGQKFKDADRQPPLYLHTTEEMLDEFNYLDKEKAYEVVVTNPNRIAERIEKISPVRPDKCSPKLPGSDEELRRICYERAAEIYGEELPVQVKDRLDTELNSIISHGYADLYIIAQKLVWKSNEDGYMVGSRGSVGSSFVAYLAGITEVNSLPPHYICSSCHYSDFESEVVKECTKTGTCGIDMPDRNCPVCGKPLQKLGFDIPFQTFLGFKGDKEPDIDLNFSSEYQSRAHKYTEEIFGKGYTFRAGTMTTLAEKTAFGFVKKYYESRNAYKRRCEIERIAEGCTGVLKTTGQHPGGIVVLPHGEEIDSFTPIQHPADKTEGSSITTHFEYHSIEHNLLKLDILGHDDPTMIKRLKDLTGIDAETIPLDDPLVMALFQDTSSIGVTPERIDGVPNGVLGIPEFGTNFVIKMLVDAKPQNISDLVRISGLSHGTGVWIGNADELILSGTATLSTCICCRDDIMIYLIGKGMDKQLSFKTMESVRKGRGLAPEMEQAMREAEVPEWYIDSCKRISYMFPKAHAAAYVMMAWRVGWYKVHYPLQYYSAFFCIRAKTFSYEKCCRGKGYLKEQMAEIKNKEKPTDQELDELHEMRLVLEMYERGFEFMPIDLYQADARYCKVVDGKIMPHLSSVTGIGVKVAGEILTKLQSSPERGPFLSKEDFCLRSGASDKMAEKLEEIGILGSMPESNQLSLFDL